VRVDFYQLSRDPVEAVVARLAEQTLRAGERLLVVAQGDAQLDAIATALWEHSPDSFLANGRAGAGHEARQPILLADMLEPGGAVPVNGARFCALADGMWRDGAEARFARVFLLFSDATIDRARGCWRTLGKVAGLERRFWKQEGRRWIEGP
jgi:DNA polymerase III subunit chi